MVTRIIYYWDRYSRNWIVQALDAEGNQVDSLYCANRQSLRKHLPYMLGLYGVAKATPIKQGR